MTKSTSFFRLRNLAAVLITLSGTGQVALLWFRELSGAGVLGALLGISYIIIGIGLFGQSRFTLFVAIVVPTVAAALILDTTPLTELNQLQTARVVVDAIVPLCAVTVLLRVRKKPPA
jgi:hypothetical protein